MLMVLVLMVYAREAVGKALCQHAIDMGENLQIWEPFLALSNSYVAMLVVPIFFLVLMADFPIMDGSYLWSVYRMGKVKWILGQIVFLVYSSVTIIVAMILSGIISCWGVFSLKNEWSNVITRYYIFAPENADTMTAQLITGDVYNHISPVEALLLAVSLSVLAMVLYGIILMCGKIYGRKYLSLAICIGTIGVGSVLRLLNLKVGFLLPISHMTLGGHYMEYRRKMIMSFGASYGYFGVLIALLILLTVIGIKGRNLCKN